MQFHFYGVINKLLAMDTLKIFKRKREIAVEDYVNYVSGKEMN